MAKRILIQKSFGITWMIGHNWVDESAFQVAFCRIASFFLQLSRIVYKICLLTVAKTMASACPSHCYIPVKVVN